MMKRKVACMLAAVLTVSVVAAGCGKTTEGQSDGNEDLSLIHISEPTRH